MNIIKRDGREVLFDTEKISEAIRKANRSVPESERISENLIQLITEDVTKEAEKMVHTPNVEDIQELVINALIRYGAAQVVKNYITYRYKRMLARKLSTTDERILAIINGESEEAKKENSNKNPILISTQRDYMAGEVSRDLTSRMVLPKDIADAHKAGLIHVHDTDYFVQQESNCCLVNLEDMLQNGTVISGTMIEKPHSFATACNIATQIIAQVASSQFGGQTITLSHLAPFVDISRQRLRKNVRDELTEAGVNTKISGEDFTEEVNKIAEKRLQKEIARGVQTIQYQIITLMTTNGQAPFVTEFMYIDEVPEGQTRDDLVLVIKETLKQRMQGVKNKAGVWVTPAFPKLIYVLDADNISPGSRYYDVTVLAAKCTAKRMVPDYISAKKMKELKGDVYPCMGCRSFLTPDNEYQPEGLCNKDNKAEELGYVTGQHKYYGRFNQGVVSINLVDVACSAVKESEENRTDRFESFWRILDERLELCHRALQYRHKRLCGAMSDVAPILWQYGALARLKPGETIDKLLYGNYSTISLGYAGLYEMCVEMTGKSHTDPEAKPFALSVMKALNDACTKWRKAENISYSVYGTPLESTTYKFAKCLQKRFGIIENVTDHNYITNSYHVNVREEINAFDKLGFEAEFQELSPGGAISYVEVPDMQDNIPAVLAVMNFIYNHIMYAELNTKSDYCEVCGYDGEIQIQKDKNGKLIWVCPNCGNTDQTKMSVARRTCGYIGTQFWNQGRTQEIKDRVLHL